MAVTTIPLRQRYVSLATGNDETSWALPIITMEGGDTFESCHAHVTGISDVTTEDIPVTVEEFDIFLKWTYGTSSSAPPRPNEPVMSGDDTIAMRHLLFNDTATVNGKAYYVFGEITGVHTYFVPFGERATLWLCSSHTFEMSSPLYFWDGVGDARVCYRAPAIRLPT